MYCVSCGVPIGDALTPICKECAVKVLLDDSQSDNINNNTEDIIKQIAVKKVDELAVWTSLEDEHKPVAPEDEATPIIIPIIIVAVVFCMIYILLIA